MRQLKEEIEILKSILKNSYAPYSNFNVAAVLKAKSGKIYTGVNIENAGIQSICAERVAFAKAISEGEKEFEYIIIGGKKAGNLIMQKLVPCGYCRQFMAEFVDGNFSIYSVEENYIKEYKLKELLPFAFKLED